MHKWLTWIVRRPEVDAWFRRTAAAQETKFTLEDREGTVRVLSSAYVKEFLRMRGVSSPSHPFRIEGPGELLLMVEWVCDEQPYFAALMKERLNDFFAAAGTPSARWALEVQRDIYARLERALLALSKPS